MSYNDDEPIEFNYEKAIDWIYPRLPKETLKRIKEEDLYAIFNLETKYMENNFIIPNQEELHNAKNEAPSVDASEYEIEPERIELCHAITKLVEKYERALPIATHLLGKCNIVIMVGDEEKGRDIIHPLIEEIEHRLDMNEKN